METKEIVEQIGKEFATFKQANDERIAQLEKRGHVDPLLIEKVDKAAAAVADLESLNQRLGTLEMKANAPKLESDVNGPADLKQKHREVWNQWVRKGAPDSPLNGQLREIEQKATSMTVATAAEGGYLVPEVVDSQIHQLLRNASPMRGLCTVQTVSTGDWKKLVAVHGGSFEWVGETTTRSATNTPQYAEVAGVFGEASAKPKISDHLLDDNAYNAEAALIEEVAAEIATGEDLAFVNGSGSNQPKGFLQYTTASTVDGTRAFGQIQYVISGLDAGFDAANASTGVNGFDAFINCMAALKAGHRANASWLMNKLTLASVMQIKDVDARNLWQPSMVAGAPGMILGFPVIEDENMPAIAQNAYPVAFGNWKAGYYILDRVGLRMLRNPFAEQGYVQYWTRKRVGGQVVDSEAIKLIKISNS